MKFYFTFGQIHTHRINGKTFDCDSVVEIHAKTESEAREKMFDIFGNKWFTSYPEDKLQLEFFPRGIIEVIK